MFSFLIYKSQNSLQVSSTASSLQCTHRVVNPTQKATLEAAVHLLPWLQDLFSSHLSEIQLSEHVGYPNACVISSYFHEGKLVVAVQMPTRSVSVLALPVLWQLNTQDSFYEQGRLLNQTRDKNNHQNQPLGTTSLPHAPSGNGNWATTYGTLCAF